MTSRSDDRSELLSVLMDDAETRSAKSATPLSDQRAAAAEPVSSDAGIGVNDETLMAFNTWRVVQQDSEASGVVIAANDYASKSCSVWWAGPKTEFLERMQAEARRNGITLIVNEAPYSLSQIQRAAEVIHDDEDRLEQSGFDLQGVSGPTSHFFGLTVIGAPVGDEHAEQLAPDIVARVRDALADLLDDSGIRLDDVKVEYGRFSDL
jgi:hypothetical protein